MQGAASPVERGAVRRLLRVAAPKPSARSWYVYVVRCRDGSLYTGVSNDVLRRVAAHNAGRGARYTRSRRPVSLLWKRRAVGKVEALRLEWRIKQLPRAEKLRLVAARRRRGA